MKPKYDLLKLLALSCILFVCVTMTTSCSLHKPSPTGVGRNSEPAVVSSGGYYEDSIKDSKQGIVSVNHPIDHSEIKKFQRNCETNSILTNICINYDDVKPTDWAFLVLKDLVERYGVIQVYSDKTFRGDRAATRYEVADMLAAAMDVIDREIKQQARESFSKKSFIELTASVDNVAAEVATLRGRMDSLEARFASLEKLKAH